MVELENFKKVSQKQKDYVFGYLRKMEKEYSIEIPMMIYQICTLFCIMRDEWDSKWTHDSYLIINDKKLKLTKRITSATAFLSQIVDQGIHCWKFKIIEYGSPGSDSFRFAIVVNDEASLPTIRSTALGCVSHTTYAWEAGFNARLIDHDDGMRWGDSYGKKCQQNDIVSMNLDFTKAILSFGINEESFGGAFAICVDKTYRAAVDMDGENDEVELISYEQIM